MRLSVVHLSYCRGSKTVYIGVAIYINMIVVVYVEYIIP